MSFQTFENTVLGVINDNIENCCLYSLHNAYDCIENNYKENNELNEIFKNIINKINQLQKYIIITIFTDFIILYNKKHINNKFIIKTIIDKYSKFLFDINQNYFNNEIEKFEENKNIEKETITLSIISELNSSNKIISDFELCKLYEFIVNEINYGDIGSKYDNDSKSYLYELFQKIKLNELQKYIFITVFTDFTLLNNIDRIDYKHIINTIKNKYNDFLFDKKETFINENICSNYDESNENIESKSNEIIVNKSIENNESKSNNIVNKSIENNTNINKVNTNINKVNAENIESKEEENSEYDEFSEEEIAEDPFFHRIYKHNNDSIKQMNKFLNLIHNKLEKSKIIDLIPEIKINYELFVKEFNNTLIEDYYKIIEKNNEITEKYKYFYVDISLCVLKDFIKHITKFKNFIEVYDFKNNIHKILDVLEDGNDFYEQYLFIIKILNKKVKEFKKLISVNTNLFDLMQGSL